MARIGITGLALAVATVAAWTSATAGDAGYDPFSANYEADHEWPRNLVRALQERLSELGTDPGPADGIYGPRTAAAIRQIQASEGLEPDGRISEHLLQNVGISQ